MMPHREITTLEEWDAIDMQECTNGYLGAQRGDPEPGDNHLRSYWHGWRMRMNDMGVIEISAAHRRLVYEVTVRERDAKDPTP